MCSLELKGLKAIYLAQKYNYITQEAKNLLIITWQSVTIKNDHDDVTSGTNATEISMDVKL